MTAIRILGIDPGFDRLGICVVDKQGNKETLIYSTCITTKKTDPFPVRLLVLGDAVENLVKEYAPQHLAIEKLFFTKNQTTAMNVAEVRGMILYLAQKYALAIFEYSPPQIKVAITGHGGASKADMAVMIPKIVKLTDQARLDDELDAIAVALTHSAHYKITLWK